jgi:hypothetical protein
MKAIGKGYNACGLLPIFWPTFQMVAMDVKVNVDIVRSLESNSTRFIDKSG